MQNVKSRKSFREGKHSLCDSQCVPELNPSFFEPGVNEGEIYPKKMVRVHCLRYGKYFTMKSKCLNCSYLLSFTQEAV